MAGSPAAGRLALLLGADRSCPASNGGGALSGTDLSDLRPLGNESMTASATMATTSTSCTGFCSRHAKALGETARRSPDQRVPARFGAMGPGAGT